MISLQKRLNMYFSLKYFELTAGCRLILIFMAVIGGCMATTDSIQAGLFSKVSGVYVANYKNGVAMIHIVETPDHYLTGNHMLTAINKEGEVFKKSSAITGAVDGSNISLNFFNGAKSITAVLLDDNLRVIGLDDSPTVFQKSDINEFEKKAAMIEVASQTFLLRKSEEVKKEKFANEVDELYVSMERFIKVSNNIMHELNETEDRLKKITANMASLLEKERQLAKDKSVDAGSAEVQLVSSIIQENSATMNLQWNFNDIQANFRAHQQSTYNRVEELEKICQTSRELSPCEKFVQKLPLYREKYSNVKKNIDSWETAYKEEKLSQDQILEQARAVHEERYKSND